MSNSHIDNLVNAVVNKISAVVNNHNSSSNAHSSLLSDYLQTTDVKDNLTSTDTNKPAKQGTELKTLVDGKSDNNHTHEAFLSSNDDSDVQIYNVSAQGYPQGEGQPLGAFLSEFWKKIYPVGSIYMSVNSTSPQTLFGGTWERIQDRFLLASGSTYSAGSTGGSADATLVSHYHGVSTTGEYFVTSSKDTANNTRVAYSSSGNRLVDGQTDTGTSSFHHRQYTTTQGSNGTGKNMPPYLSVYVWKRTA